MSLLTLIVILNKKIMIEPIKSIGYDQHEILASILALRSYFYVFEKR